jgi:UDP-N-acetylmuramoyl-L-alanyl-D-glutamate--2,6-diaminopimelate ligase
MSNAAPAMHKPGWNAVTDRASSVRTRNLRALLAGAGVVVPQEIPAGLEITDLSIDSRRIAPGGAFIALRGLRSHGVDFATQAIDAGARAILWEPADGLAAPVVPKHVALIAVHDLGALAGTLADRFFDAPSESVCVAAVTGTNGKTTTAYVLAAALAALGKSSAYAGTLGFGRIDAIEAGTHTTPDAVTVHREVAELRDAGVTHLGMEVSSHALDQQRIAGLRVDTAVFTNLTHDHLDYHGTLEAYGAAKARLFAWPALAHAVINIEDPFGRELALRQSTGSALTVCGRSEQAASFAGQLSGSRALTQVFATQVNAGALGLEIDIDTSWGFATLRTRFVGDFNVDNVLAVLGVLLGWGISLDRASRAIEQCVAPPGRMETFGAPGRPLAIVDYAHTPDALDKALSAARRHCSGKLICVLGCGGDRDAGKRPVMGAIAERLADVVIVTDDNPRTEDGDAIVAQIVAGLAHPQRAVIERNRAVAIERAVHGAAAGDVVLIAGKGHEDYQIVGLEKRYFSDRDVAKAALQGARA